MEPMTSIVKRLWGDPQGSVSLMFAFAALVLIGVVGAAMDYSRAANVQTNLQRAVDGAALLAAKNNRDMSGSPMSDAAATDFLRKTFTGDRISDLNATVTFLSDRVQVNATAIVPTTLMNLLGIKTMPVSGRSEALFGDTKAEIVLVLDNTGSMNQANKLPTLKLAANNFLNKMQANTGPTDAIRVGVVPFETNVNLGSLKNSWWVDPAQTSYWTTHPLTTGCIWDRDQPNDAKDTPPNTGVIGTMFGADQTRATPCGIGPILPLTGDYGALHASIDGMVASGTTNLTIGLVWGYHLLSPSEPVTNALPFGTKNLSKYIILMTDGDNTKMRGTTDIVAMDARTRQVCDSIKADKILVFTARIIDGNESLLRDCASSPTMYYSVNDVSQLQPVFDSIYNTITNMRIAR
jgi:Flp pilus assembly protein TadG